MNAHTGDLTPTENDALEHAGQNILGLLQKASAIAERNTQHAINAAHRLAIQLRTAEARIAELELALRSQCTRADRAEEWLRRISHEIEQRLSAENTATMAPSIQPNLEPYVRRRQKVS
jgi:hypothetical protein